MMLFQLESYLLNVFAFMIVHILSKIIAFICI